MDPNPVEPLMRPQSLPTPRFQPLRPKQKAQESHAQTPGPYKLRQ